MKEIPFERLHNSGVRTGPADYQHFLVFQHSSHLALTLHIVILPNFVIVLLGVLVSGLMQE